MGSAAERRKSGGDDGEDPEWEGFGGCELPLVFLFYARVGWRGREDGLGVCGVYQGTAQPADRQTDYSELDAYR